jgi:hypothetical protein
MHRCLLTLPNSYAADDGKEVCAAGFADNKKEADENACCAVFAILCSDLRGGLPQVILRSSHYNVSPQELVDDIVGIINGDGPGSGPSATVPPLAEHHAASGATFAGTLQDVPEADKERAAEVIRLILQSHGGGFFPNKINHKKFEEVAGKQQVKAHAQLGRLLPLNSLRPFIQPHPEFDSEYKEGRLYIKWQSQTSEADPWSGWQTSVAAASGASSASASAAHPALAIQLLESNRVVEAVGVVETNHHEAALEWENVALQARQSFYLAAAVNDQAGAAAGGDARDDSWSWTGSLQEMDWQPSSAAASGAPSASASAAPPDVVEGDTPEPEHYGEEVEEFLRNVEPNGQRAQNETLNAWGSPTGETANTAVHFGAQDPGESLDSLRIF